MQIRCEDLKRGEIKYEREGDRVRKKGVVPATTVSARLCESIIPF